MKNMGNILLVAIIVSLLLPVANSVKYLICGILLALWLLTKLPSFLFMKACRAITTDKGTEKSWKQLEKAIKWGINDQYLLTGASVYIQRGDWKKGKEILNGFISKPASKKGLKDEKLIPVAKTMLSMTSWLEGDLDGAITIMKGVHDGGYRDKNMFINYESYVLEKGDMETAGKLLEESTSIESQSMGLRDNHGWYDILKGDWNSAEAIYTPLVEKNPAFPEPYVHMAQIMLHYGEVKEAIGMLEKGLGARFTQTSGIKAEFIKGLKEKLEDPKSRIKVAKSVDASIASVAHGVMPSLLEGDFPESDADTLAGFAERKKEETKIDGETKKEAPVEDENRLPDTSLSSDDDEYLKRHDLS